MTEPQKTEGAQTGEAFTPGEPIDIFLLARLGFTFIFVVLTALVAQPYLESLTWALVLAIVFIRPHRWFESFLGPNSAAAMSVATVALIIVAPLLFIGQRLIKEAMNGVTYIQNTVSDGKWSSFVESHRWLKWIGDRVDVPTIAARGGELFTNISASLLKQSTGQIITMVLAFYMLFFFLRDRNAALDALVRVSPFSGMETGKLILRVRDTIHATIYGTLAVAALQGALGGIAFWWLGFPSPALWAVVMTVISIIPVLGSFVIWIPATIYLALEDRWADAVTLGLWGGVVISTADNVLRPLFVGETLRLHTAPAFVAMLGGLQLFGPPGLILGPVAFTMTTLMLEFWRRRADPDLQPK
ncbi:AI-2E family transporter [Methylocystis echinoides]|uniref:AI-2E family transporter n=1 Tax=Methylocystis echinoides TaxID=29468 RepID=A0A9W6GTD8_9HYPH|nr:AI-2E family transporter [Methylocystis echinoides]GLI92490.1 AI-2E family transporter [Methylocystis echinoides]